MLSTNLKWKPSTGSASIPTKEVELVEEVEGPQELDLNTLTMAELKYMATEKGIDFDSRIRKSELIEKLA